MNVTFAPKGILQIDDARIIFRNFEGKGSAYNREGDRNFSIVIDDEFVAESLEREGWNVKRKPPREDGDRPFMYLNVKVKFNDRGPQIYTVSGNNRSQLDEETCGMIDNLDIAFCNMDIRPYDWEVNGKTGRTAYLQAIEVHQNIDRFASRYSNDIDIQQADFARERM